MRSLAKLPARPLAAAQGCHKGPYDELPPTHDLQFSQQVLVPSPVTAVRQYTSLSLVWKNISTLAVHTVSDLETFSCPFCRTYFYTVTSVPVLSTLVSIYIYVILTPLWCHSTVFNKNL